MKHIKTEAKLSKKDGDKAIIMGIPVVITPMKRVLEELIGKVREKDFTKPLFVATAYSEFFQEAQKNPRFMAALQEADMVVPDGVIVKAAMDYLEMPNKGELNNLWQGLKVGKRILAGGYKERIVGVRLMEVLMKLAVQNKYRVFLLGGQGGVAERLANTWKDKGLNVEWDGGFENAQTALTHPTLSKPVTEKINKFKPDLLFVALGRFKQELWIHQQKENLRAGVIVGVGSSFDELAREGYWKEEVPAWVESRGLKWLWRATKDKRHIQRAWNAFPVFAWQIWQYKRKRQ